MAQVSGLDRMAAMGQPRAGGGGLHTVVATVKSLEPLQFEVAGTTQEKERFSMPDWLTEPKVSKRDWLRKDDQLVCLTEDDQTFLVLGRFEGL